MSLDEAIQELNRVEETLTELLAGIDAGRINSVPSPGSWSIAQHIDHLIIINRSYYPIIEDVREGKYKAPLHGRIQPLVNWFGKMILKSVRPEYKRKTKTFPIWEPPQDSVNGHILEAFIAHQEELKNFFNENRDLIERKVTIPSPANKNIVYTFDQAMEIMVVHEWRHIDHIRRILQE